MNKDTAQKITEALNMHYAERKAHDRHVANYIADSMNELFKKIFSRPCANQWQIMLCTDRETGWSGPNKFCKILEKNCFEIIKISSRFSNEGRFQLVITPPKESGRPTAFTRYTMLLSKPELYTKVSELEKLLRNKLQECDSESDLTQKALAEKIANNPKDSHWELDISHCREQSITQVLDQLNQEFSDSLEFKVVRSQCDNGESIILKFEAIKPTQHSELESLHTLWKPR